MIRLFYPTDPNFGDLMSPLIVEKLSGQKVVPSGMWNADMMAVGSVFYRGDYLMGDLNGSDTLGYFKAMVHCTHARLSPLVKVWGSGFLQYPPFKMPYFKRRIKVYALRGKLTRDILEGLGLMDKDVVCAYGDPGLLFASLFKIEMKTKWDIGVIPHYFDKQHGWGGRLLKAFTDAGFDAHLIDVRQNPIDVVSMIAKCAKVISSSLHGLIVADSLGIPNMRMELTTLSHSRHDYELKFKDYYSAFGEVPPPAVSARALLEDTHNLMRHTVFRQPNSSCIASVRQSLIETFPHDDT